jgi:DNA-binding Lrp family transcriptional regulator
MWRLVDVWKWHGQGRPEARTPAEPRRPQDEVDAELLRILARDPRLSYRELGALVGEPYSVVRRRTQQLFAEGAIQASAVLDRSTADAGTTGLLGLTMAGSGIDECLEFAVQRPEIAIVARTLGRFAATLEVVCETPGELVAVADRMSELPAVTGVSTYLYARSPVLPMPWLFSRLGGR